jgi:tRNA 2-thiouridine synthesizing protein A
MTIPIREEPALVLDCLGWKCPRPIIELARRLGDVGVGELIELVADDPAAGPDVAAWCRMRHHELAGSAAPHFFVRRLS